MTATILRADARAIPMPDASVDLIVTSPPYFALRSYTDGGEHYGGQIGAEATPREYIAALLDCTREWTRVLKPAGSIFVNLGDKYAGANATRPKGCEDSGLATAGRYNAAAHNTGIPNKSLMLLPERYRIGCVDELGLIARAVLVWAKPNGLPESVTDRVRRSHEDWVHLTKQPRYFSAVDEIREPHAASSLARYAQGDPISGVRERRAAVSVSGGATPFTAANPLGKLPGSVWEIATEPLKVPAELGVDHFAAFPTEWPRRIILGWSPSGICTACGEGRRPVMDREQVARRPIGRSQMHTAYDARADKGTRSNIGHVVTEHRIVGEGCACGYDQRPESSATSAHDPQSPSYPSPSSSGDPHAEQTSSSSSSMSPTLPPTRPAVVLDPFGGTGTTALVASVLGRHGISVDMSADYCRLARWRTTDPGQRAKAARVEAPPKQLDGQADLLDLIA